jgi:hypothetical protein
MPVDLNQYTSFITEEGRFATTITEAKEDFTKSGENCITTTFTTPEGSAFTTQFQMNEKWGWKLKKLAEAARLSQSEISNFEPEMLVGKSVDIVLERGEKYLNLKTTLRSETPAVAPAQRAPKPATRTNEDVPF